MRSLSNVLDSLVLVDINHPAVADAYVERGMAGRKNRRAAEIGALLEEMLVDAYGDDEQLTALADGIADALDLPVEVHVVGEPLSLLAVDYDGNARRGIVARCRREDGTEYGVSLADVELPPTEAGNLHAAAYCRWLGVEPAASHAAGVERVRRLGSGH